MKNSTLKTRILKNIERVFQESENSQLEPLLFKKTKNELTFLAEYFQTTETQALFIAVIFTLNYKTQNVDFEYLNEHFNCNPMNLLVYSEDLMELANRRIIRKTSKNYHRTIKLKGADETFCVNEIISEKILMGESLKYPLLNPLKYDDIFTLLEKLHELATQRSEGEINSVELFENVENVLKENENVPLIAKLKPFGLSVQEKYVFLYIVWRFLEGEKDVWLDLMCKELYDRPRERFNQIQTFLEGGNLLQKQDWLCLVPTAFFNDTKIKLTLKAMDFLVECGIKLYNKKGKDNQREDFINPQNIPFRELVFNAEENEQINRLKCILDPQNFKKTQERLLKKKRHTGITVLFHGAPGTGKTETVLQIAKATNRNMLKVDISASRSMWFGESEKIIKQIFKDYHAYAKEQSAMPILFFNEADAIIAQRKTNHASVISDTENRIQNILLEEFEHFNGILMATSNLVQHIDRAFERRFLFKIEFKNPGFEAKSAIWKSKFPHLSHKDCRNLATSFNLSGGQIDNIARKNEIHEIVHEKNLCLRSIMALCREETFISTNSSPCIGFTIHASDKGTTQIQK
jgi:hypothetical protein